MRLVLGVRLPESWWRWKYLENPHGWHASHVALTDDEEIIALVGAVPYTLSFRAQEATAVQISDVAVHPRWRGSNVFDQTYRRSVAAFDQRVAFYYGLGREQATNYVVRRITEYGFTRDSGFVAPRLDKVLCLRPFLQRYTKNRVVVEAVTLLSLPFLQASMFPLRLFRPRSVTIEEVESFDQRFDRLWDEVAPSSLLATVRTSRYLNWRYTAHPLFRYRIFAAVEGERILGFVVVRCHVEKGVKNGYILETLVVPDRHLVFWLLLDQALRFFREQHADKVSCWMVQHSTFARRSLRALLFFPRYSPHRCLSHAFRGPFSNEFLHDPRHWYVTIGDTDLL